MRTATHQSTPRGTDASGQQRDRDQQRPRREREAEGRCQPPTRQNLERHDRRAGKRGDKEASDHLSSISTDVFLRVAKISSLQDPISSTVAVVQLVLLPFFT